MRNYEKKYKIDTEIFLDELDPQQKEKFHN